jgi:hypothetical protein
MVLETMFTPAVARPDRERQSPFLSNTISIAGKCDIRAAHPGLIMENLVASWSDER